MSEQKINDEIIEKKAAELIEKFGNPIIDQVNGCYIKIVKTVNCAIIQTVA